MRDPVDPRKVPEEEEGAGDRRGEVEEQMREHDHVCLVAHDRLGETDVRLQQPSIHPLWHGLRVEVEPIEHGRHKVRALGVIECSERRDGGVLAVW